MENKNYTATIEVAKSPKEVFDHINEVSKWWTENLEGDSKKLNDVFIVHFTGDAFVTQKLIEVFADKKIVWLVTDCYLPWLKNTTEWTNTKMSFEISTKGNSTIVNFAHIGLVPDFECYDSCVKGWDQYIKGSLPKLISEGKGEPQAKKA